MEVTYAGAQKRRDSTERKSKKIFKKSDIPVPFS